MVMSTLHGDDHGIPRDSRPDPTGQGDREPLPDLDESPVAWVFPACVGDVPTLGEMRLIEADPTIEAGC
jgi:hypothetical protein